MNTYTLVLGELIQNLTIDRIDLDRADVVTNRAAKMAAVRSIRPNAKIVRIPVQGRSRVVAVMPKLNEQEQCDLRCAGIDLTWIDHTPDAGAVHLSSFYAIC